MKQLSLGQINYRKNCLDYGLSRIIDTKFLNYLKPSQR